MDIRKWIVRRSVMRKDDIKYQNFLKGIKKKNKPLNVGFTCLRCDKEYDVLDYIVKNPTNNHHKLSSLCSSCRIEVVTFYTVPHTIILRVDIEVIGMKRKWERVE